ncbi:unnamed protein product [Closterium sp. NIES-54]
MLRESLPRSLPPACTRPLPPFPSCYFPKHSARQLEVQFRDLQNTVFVLQAQLQEAKTKVKAAGDERDHLKAQLKSQEDAVRDPADPQVRMENVRKDVAGNPIIPSSLSCDNAFDERWSSVHCGKNSSCIWCAST